MKEWATENPGWTFLLAFIALCIVCSIASSTLKTIAVIARGWPPEHLDAYGNFREEDDKPEEKKDE